MLRSLPLQDTVDLSTSGPTRLQLITAAAVILGLLGLTAILNVKLRYSGLTAEQERHRKAIKQSLHRRDPRTIHLTERDVLERRSETRDRLLEAITTEQEEADSVGVLTVLRAVGDEIEAALDPYLGPIPALARWLASLTIWSAVFGFVAFSTEFVAGALRNGPAGGGGDPIGGLLSIPVIGTLLELGATVLLLLGITLVQSWVITTVLLGLLALTVYLAHRESVEREAPVLPRWTDPAAKWAGRGLGLFVAVYAVLTVISLPRLIGAFLAAPLLTKGLLVLAGGFLALATSVLATLNAPEVAETFKATARRERVRLAAVRRGLPLGTVVIAYIAISYYLGIVWSVVLSVAIGLMIQRFGTVAIRFAEGRPARGGEDERRRRGSVVIHVLRPEDADGVVRPVTQVGGTRLAWSEEERLVETTLEAAEARLSGEGIPPTIEAEYADDLIERGETDPEVTINRVRQRVREWLDLRGTVIPVEAVDTELTEKYPEEITEPLLRDLRRRGKLNRRPEHYEVA
jgi:hypothetical protein